jgi:hypothetical protein
VSALDTLAVASMMTPKQIADAGLSERVEKARKQASDAIETALGSLKEFNVSSKDLTQLIDRRIAEAADVIRRVAKD